MDKAILGRAIVLLSGSKNLVAILYCNVFSLGFSSTGG
jgi:hypothetical protein